MKVITALTSIVVAGLLTLTVSAPAFAATADIPAAPTNGYVVDEADILTTKDANTINSNIDSIHKETGDAIAVLIADSLDGATVEDYSLKVANAWGVGEAGKDNGVLIVLAMEEHKIRIEVGSGIHDVITDSEAQTIINDIITPNMKESQYLAAVNGAVTAVGEQFEAGVPAPAKADPFAGYVAAVVILSIAAGVFLILFIIFLSLSIHRNRRIDSLSRAVVREAREKNNVADRASNETADLSRRLNAITKSPEGQKYTARVKAERIAEEKRQAEARERQRKIDAQAQKDKDKLFKSMDKDTIAKLRKTSSRSEREKIVRNHIAATGGSYQSSTDNLIPLILLMGAVAYTSPSSYSHRSSSSSYSDSSSSYSSSSFDSGSSFSGGGFDGGGASGGW